MPLSCSFNFAAGYTSSDVVVTSAPTIKSVIAVPIGIHSGWPFSCKIGLPSAVKLGIK